jgi:hypothetical protein
MFAADVPVGVGEVLSICERHSWSLRDITCDLAYRIELWPAWWYLRTRGLLEDRLGRVYRSPRCRTEVESLALAC